jgi:AhpD family alkylhydroperoxidase
MDHGPFHQMQSDLRGPYRDLGDAIPDVMAAYRALSTKTKELIARAISVTRECDGCVVAHARGAAQRGATDEEVAEAIGVAINLNGGPGTVWGARALAAFREYARS